MDEQKTPAISATTLFYAYAQTDEKLRQKLEKHLSVLSQQGLITIWHDRQIVPGTNRKQALDDYLNTASIILLLISSDFMASDYCSSIEMQHAFARHEKGNARVIPILLRPVDWEKAPFSSFQPLPHNRKPVTTWTNQDAAFLDITKGIRRAIEDFSPTMHNSSLHWDQQRHASQHEMMARREYLEHLEERYAFIILPMGPVEGLALQAVFQPLKLRPDPVAAEDCRREERRHLLGETAYVENEPGMIAQNGEDALAKSPQNRIIVLGGPGTGKTTLLQSLISERTQQALIDLTAPLPIFLSLPDLARSGKTMPEYLVRLMQETGESEHSTHLLLWRAIEEGRAFICLDGLDEVTPRERPEIIRLINERAARPGNIWVIGSRFTEYKGGQFKRGQFAEWELLPLDDEMRLRFAQLLLPELSRLLLRADSSIVYEPAMLVQSLENHQRATAWGENPLLFSLAAIVFVRTGTLPTSRAALYQQVIDAVVEMRELDRTRRKMLLRVSMSLALELYQRKGRIFTRDTLVELLPAVRQRQHENWSTEEMVNRIVVSGLLDIVAQETYGFRHQTFQEYLAAAELAYRLVHEHQEVREEGWSFAWGKRIYSRWTEVLRLMVGVLVQNYSQAGTQQALRWLQELSNQHTSDVGDIGNLGLELALSSLPEISTNPSHSWRALEGKKVEERIIASWITSLRESITEEFVGFSAHERRLLSLSDEVNRLGRPLLDMAVERLLTCLDEKNERIREIALEALAPLQEHIAVEPILALLNDSDSYVIYRAVGVLGKMKKRVPVSHLLRLLDHHEDWYVRYSVEHALVACEEYVPAELLREALASENWWTRVSVAKVLAQRGEPLPIAMFLAELCEADEERRKEAVELFGWLGESAPMEQILSALEDESYSVRSSASDALGQLGGRVPLEALLQALRSANSDTRHAAARALERLTEHVSLSAPFLVETLVTLLSDTDWFTRSSVARALGNIRVGVPVEPLLKALHDEGRYVRRDAADALVKIGEYPAEEQIVKEIASHLVWMRRTAWQVISLVYQHIPRELLQPVLESALHDAEGSIRAEAIKIYAQMNGHSSVDLVMQAVLDPDPCVRRAAVEALGKMENSILREPLPTKGKNLGEGETQTLGGLLLHVLHDPDKSVQSMASWALGQQTGCIPREALRELLNDEQETMRCQAVKILGRSGRDAPIEHLLKMLHDSSYIVISEVVHALEKLAAYLPLESLLVLVRHEDPQMRVAGLKIIGHLEQPIPPDLLSQAMNDDEMQVRVAAIGAAGKKRVHAFLSKLLSFLEDGEQQIRVAAIEALEQFVGEDVPVEIFHQALGSPWQEVRIGAATILGSRGESTAVQTLLTMLDDHNADEEPAIARALGKLKVQAAINPLCKLLLNHRVESGRAIIKALGEIGGPAAAEALFACLWRSHQPPYSPLRVEAVNALGKLEDETIIETLRSTLGDSEQEIRNEVLALFRKRSPDIVCSIIPEALAIVQGGAPGRILGSMAQGVIADTIGQFKCPSFSPLFKQLIPLLDWPYWEVRLKAIEALGHIQRNIPDEAIRGLLRLRHDPQSHTVRRAAEDVLAAILSLETGIEDD